MMLIYELPVFVPVKTPHTIVARLNQELVPASGMPELMKCLGNTSFLIRASTAEDLRRHLASESGILRAAARKFGIKADR